MRVGLASVLRAPWALVALAAAAMGAANAQALQEGSTGFLCCHLRSDGAWIIDGNVVENGKGLLDLGTPVESGLVTRVESSAETLWAVWLE